MLTPQEISKTEFTKAVFGGYDMSSVDSFIENVSSDYAALYKENNILKSKLKVLVDKIEEYRSTEDAMRMALLTAQTMGDEIISEANTKRDKILSEAEDIAQNKVTAVRAELEAEQGKLRAAKAETAKCVAHLRALMAECDQQLDKLVAAAGTPEEEPAAPAVSEADAAAEAASTVAEAMEDSDMKVVEESKAEDDPDKREQDIMGAAMEIDSVVSKLVENTPDYKAADEGTPADKTKVFQGGLKYDDEDEPTSPRPKFNFDDLQFGSNYDTGRI